MECLYLVSDFIIIVCVNLCMSVSESEVARILTARTHHDGLSLLTRRAWGRLFSARTVD